MIELTINLVFWLKKLLQLKHFHNFKIGIKKTPVKVVWDLVAQIYYTLYPIPAQFDWSTTVGVLLFLMTLTNTTLLF